MTVRELLRKLGLLPQMSRHAHRARVAEVAAEIEKDRIETDKIKSRLRKHVPDLPTQTVNHGGA